MELMISWFWLVGLTLTIAGVFIAYKSVIVHHLKSKLWNTLLVVAIFIGVFNPIKMEQNMQNRNAQQTYGIESTKVLPDKVKDNSFRENYESMTKRTLDHNN